MRVVHLSKTPLAGSPGRLAYYSSLAGAQAVHFYEQDYPGDLAGKMTSKSLSWGGNSLDNELLASWLACADVVHVHNYISKEMVLMVNKFSATHRIVLHVHSPLREGPLYANVESMMDLAFTRKFVVAQYQPRHYQDYTPVCNIVPESPMPVSRQEGSRLSVLFSPAHNRAGGRWNPKGSSALDWALRGLMAQRKVSLVSPPKCSSEQLLGYRAMCDVSVDEIVTGSYHQISLEGLSAGNIVVNNADFFSIEMLKLAARISVPPPFVKMDGVSCFDGFRVLSEKSQDEICELRSMSREYFEKYLSPVRLATLLLDEYAR